jgi:hypothetical protein
VAASLIQVAAGGIAAAWARADSPAGAQPPPTDVHNGW